MNKHIPSPTSEHLDDLLENGIVAMSFPILDCFYRDFDVSILIKTKRNSPYLLLKRDGWEQFHLEETAKNGVIFDSLHDQSLLRILLILHLLLRNALQHTEHPQSTVRIVVLLKRNDYTSRLHNFPTKVPLFIHHHLRFVLRSTKGFQYLAPL